MSNRNYLAEPIIVSDPVIRSSDLLASTWDKATANSGGPPYPGAMLQDNEDGEIRWTAILGQHLYLDDGSTYITLDSGALLLT